VVSFQVQNGKLFMFDVSGQRTGSAVVDPPNLLEAYPMVEIPDVMGLRGSDRYVFIDPSAGLNQFGITTDLFEDRALRPNAPQADTPVRVGLAFMQNFRALADGVTYEEIFTGQVAGESVHTIWGTLGLSLRRYDVGSGYRPTPDPGVPHYFATGYRSAPDSGGLYYDTPVKWNFRQGMSPVKIMIGAGAARAQADFPNVDVLGAFRRGVESWNDVFGFPVFEATFVNDDAVRDDDKSFIVVDYPGTGVPYAFGDFRANPINGEIRGASVYFSGAFFDAFPSFDDAKPAHAPAAGTTSAPTSLRAASWAGMAVQPACIYPAHLAAAHAPAAAAAGAAAHTADEKRALFIQHVVAHEIGHTLGLRHNFAGSLEVPVSSLMDYIPDDAAIETAKPGAYDVEAIRYLYRLSRTLPTHRFCTDEQVSTSPLCQPFDLGADPLPEYSGPIYSSLAGLVLDGSGQPTPELVAALSESLNAVLAFARDVDTVDPAERTNAITIALGRTAVPMSAADRRSPAVVGWANELAEGVLGRIVMDDPSVRGPVSANVSDPAVIALVASQAGRMLRNEDGVRTPALRRTAVDVLERLQADAGLLELDASRDAIRAALRHTPAADVPFVEDILARIDQALTPYFD
jgi:hypothetical protein